MAVPKVMFDRRRAGEKIEDSARNKMIRESIIIVQATVGRQRLSNVLLEICAAKICDIVHEFKNPTPPNVLDFKPYVSISFVHVDPSSYINLQMWTYIPNCDLICDFILFFSCRHVIHFSFLQNII